MIRLRTRYAVWVLLAGPGLLTGQVSSAPSTQQGPADYAVLAASDARRVQARVAQLVGRSVADVVPDCGKLATTCRALRSKSDPSSSPYSARILDPLFYTALLPNELTIRGVPYFAWIPVEEVRDGAATLERWSKLAADRAALGCEGEECTIMLTQPPDERHRATTISVCRAEGSVGHLDVPKQCDAVAVLSQEGKWLRAVIGWGNAQIATELGSSPIVESYEVEESLSILSLPNGKRGAVVQAIEAALKSPPLLLTTEFRPPVNPNAVKGRRASAESQVIRDFREWASVRADVDPAVKSAGDTTVSTIELTTLLWLSRTASPAPTRPASATETASYHAKVRANVMREIGHLCGGAFAGSRIVCK